MKCYRHPEVDSVADCVRCQRLICAECQRIWQGKVYCITCYEQLGIKSEHLDNTAKRDIQSVPKKKSSPIMVAFCISIWLLSAYLLLGAITKISTHEYHWEDIEIYVGIAIFLASFIVLGIIELVKIITNKTPSLQQDFKSLSKRKKVVFASIGAVILIALIAIPLANQNIERQKKVEYELSHTPLLSEDEACALVQNYLQSQINQMTSESRVEVQRMLNNTAPSFYAIYIGEGRWSVTSLGERYNTEQGLWQFSGTAGQWYVYEKSGIVEPGNAYARDLMQHWQTLKSVATTEQTKQQTSSPSPEPSLRDFYLKQAKWYQQMASSELDSANNYLRRANWEMDIEGYATSMYSYYMRQYQRSMENYARYTEMANEYMIKAQQEP